MKSLKEQLIFKIKALWSHNYIGDLTRLERLVVYNVDEMFVVAFGSESFHIQQGISCPRFNILLHVLEDDELLRFYDSLTLEKNLQGR